MRKKKYRINIFDIVIVLLVICVGGGLYFYTHREKVEETQKLRYTFELVDCPVGFSQKIKVGDAITDNVKNYHMGEVVEVSAVENKKLANDLVNHQVVESVVPDKETVLVTVEANVTQTESDFKVDGSYIVKAGKEVSIKGNGYAGVGYILTIER